MRKRWIFLAIIASLFIASLWDKYPAIKNTAHAVLDPSLGAILNWNILIGMIIILAVLSFLMTLVQKYTTNQKEMREMKEEQKKLQAQMKEYKDHPQKLAELNKKQMEFMGRMFKESMNSIVYTTVPIILLFRWFGDYFAQEAVASYRFLGFLSWIWFYLIAFMILSSVFRKVLKVA